MSLGANCSFTSLQSPMFDGKVPHWYHFSCFWKVGHSILQPDVEVDGFSELRWDDQQKVKKTAETGGVTGVYGGRSFERNGASPTLFHTTPCKCCGLSSAVTISGRT